MHMARNLTLFLAIALAHASFGAGELAGLWKAKKRFGPDARGMLIVQRRASGAYTADMIGRVFPVAVAPNGELSFTIPNGGRFRGRPDRRGGITGHWLRTGTPLFMGRNGAPVNASPVVLRPDGVNRWRGVVDPIEDSFTLFLLLQPQPDGSFSALLRNPDRDIGTQQGVERLVVEGRTVRLMGRRAGKEQEVATGTWFPDGDVFTLRFPNRGGTYDFLRDDDSSDFYPRGRNPGRYVYAPPPALDDGWAVSTLDAEGVDRASMEKLIQRIVDMPMDAPDTPQLHGLLVVRHGKVVLEEYFHGEHRDKLHDTRSATKSLVSIVVGAAMQAGIPLKLSSPVYQVMNGGAFPKDLEPMKRAMTLEHLLTMSNGYFCDDTNDAAPGNEEVMGEQEAEPDFYRYTMNVPMATPPGENAVYCSASPNLALGMVGRAAREDPIQVFDRLVGEPMQIRRYAWGLDPAGNPYGGGSTSMILRDFAKMGQLILNGGVWNGRRIVSRDYAASSGAPLYNLRNITYGYQWWSENVPYKNRVVHAFNARGAGGQSVTVVPELDLVVATFAGNFGSRKGMMAASTDLVYRTIMPAVREPGDDPRLPVLENDYVSPYGASKDGSRVLPRKP